MGFKTDKFLFAAVLMCCFIIASSVNGQKLSFNSWNTEAGLSRNSVYAITQDQSGFIWIGAGTSLNRFDGIEFRVFAPPPESKAPERENDISALLVDENNLMWIGMNDGLKTFDPAKNQFHQIALNNVKRGFSIFSIFQDSLFNIWIASSMGVYRRKKGSGMALEKIGSDGPEGIGAKTARCAFSDKEGNLWVGTGTELTRIRFTANGLQYKVYSRHKLLALLNFLPAFSNATHTRTGASFCG